MGINLGTAYGSYTPSFVLQHRDLVDFVEVPFELLEHDPSVARLAEAVPMILHCASMSIAGTVPVARPTVDRIRYWIDALGSPWLGEHLSFITADCGHLDGSADQYAPGEPYNLGYTVNPPFNDETLDLVVASLDNCGRSFPVPTILENAPVYLVSPGSTMTQGEFIAALCRRSNTQLLLDLAHFYISAVTYGHDPKVELAKFPLDRVMEVHVSGVAEDVGDLWDNHASRAPDVVLELLRLVLQECTPKALTLEYNWSSQFPQDVLSDEIERFRRLIRN